LQKNRLVLVFRHFYKIILLVVLFVPQDLPKVSRPAVPQGLLTLRPLTLTSNCQGQEASTNRSYLIRSPAKKQWDCYFFRALLFE